jgi:hypothetical protein
MRRPSLWLVAVTVLLGVLILREPRLRRADELLLGWMLQHSNATLPPAQVTVVEIGREDFQDLTPLEKRRPLAKGEASRRSLSPLEYALFLQAALEFQPSVIAIEPILVWRARDKMQEQVFLDQAMRVPKLMVALELGGKDDHDISTEDVPFLPDVRGPRGDLAVFSGVRRQPDDDLRLIATPGFVNLPSGSRNLVRVPMVFEYRGEIVPSFPLEAILLWLRATPAEVKVELGSQITLPNGWKIPLNRDGTATINPAAWSSVRRLGLDDLLLAAHEREHHPQTHDFSLKDQIVVLRLAGDPLQQSTAFPAAIATIQDGAYVHAAPTTVEWLFILLAALLACLYRMISRADFFFGAVLFTAAYGLLELGLLSQHRLWLPMLMPLALVWFLFVVRVFDREGLIKHEIVATA